MRKYIVLFVTLFFVLSSLAQVAKVQQWKAIVSQGRKDTVTLITLDSLANFYGTFSTDSGFYYLQQLKALAESLHHRKYLRSSQRAISQRYFIQGKTAQALQEIYQLLAVSKSMNDSALIAQDYLGIGHSYKEYGDFNKSIFFYKKAYDIALASNNKVGLHGSCLNLGYVYAQINKLDSALYYEQQAYTIGYENRNTAGIFLQVSEIYLGDIQYKLGNYKVAEGYYYSAYNKIILERQIRFGSRPLVWTTLGLANCFKAFNQLDSPLFFAKKSLENARKMDYLKGIRDAQKTIATIYDQTNQLDSAYHYQKLYVAANDSMYNRDKASAIESLAFEENLKEQEELAEIQKIKEERNHNIQLAITAIAILSIIILFLLLSRSILVSHKVVEFLSVLVLLVVFEFINLLIHPFLESITHHSPFLMLLGLVAIASLIIPLHHRLEKWTTNKLVEKNKAIRLSNAKKTIEELEKLNDKS